MKKINTIIFGATGSIGSSVLSIAKSNSDRINIEGMTCNRNIQKLEKLAKLFEVKKIGFNEKNLVKKHGLNLKNYDVFYDTSDFHNIITKKTDVIIFATIGLDTLNLFLKILKSGKKVGVANKECIISLGQRVNKISKKYNTKIIPLDSEHNSIYQLLHHNLGKFESATITATGGPFIDYDYKSLKNVKFHEAIKHPIWKMGNKISIDSATMMNKALEMIEAKYLFDLEDNQINAIIHPQAIVHALLNYGNGMSTAILNNPDMRIPISSLFFDLNKSSLILNNLDLTKQSRLEFFKIDHNKFPAIKLGSEVMSMGGLAPHVFNYLNEILVNLFINEKIKFTDIVRLNKINLVNVFNKNLNITNPKYNDMINISRWIDNNLYLGKH